jgi:triacylglycerol esterase/lipase EstA (alpha/beta hydrolase family)
MREPLVSGELAYHRHALIELRRLKSRVQWRSLAAMLLAVLAVSLLWSARARASDYPVTYNFPAGLAESVVYPTPPGANIWSCRPTAQHPQPVVLVPGLTGSMARDWQAASPLLANNGYCVFAYDFSSEGQEAIEPAAAGLAKFVNKVIGATGSSHVDLVSHSEGGVIARYYLEFLAGAANTSDLVQISPLNHGTTLFGVSTLAQEAGLSPAISSICAPCGEQTAGSSFMHKLNGHGDTLAGVNYTVIGTRNDEIITPYQSQFLSGSQVDNILLQEQCSLDNVDHLASQYDSISLRDMLNALDPAHSVPPACHPVLPGVGG